MATVICQSATIPACEDEQAYFRPNRHGLSNNVSWSAQSGAGEPHRYGPAGARNRLPHPLNSRRAMRPEATGDGRGWFHATEGWVGPSCNRTVL
jgi:hypothetical protein